MSKISTILSCLTLFFTVNTNTCHSQVFVDNVFAFGFENTFGWNVVFMDSKVKDSYVRIVLFDEIATIRDRLIVCQIGELKGQALYEVVELGKHTVVDSLPNPYSTEKTLIIADKQPGQAHAIISHFGYLLTVSCSDRTDWDIEHFKRFLRTYVNMKLDM